MTPLAPTLAPPLTIATRLRLARRTQQVLETQAQVANAVGLTRRRISEIENNTGEQLGVHELHALACHYGQPVDWFQRPTRPTRDAVGVTRDDGPL